MTKPDLMALAEQERSELLGLLGSLTSDQWRTKSLCAGWSVRDVAVHIVSYDELSKFQLAQTFARGVPRVSSVNEVALRKYADLTPEQVVDLVERCQRPRGLTAGFGGGIALADGMIHQQDIRRAIGRPRPIPHDRLQAVLEFALKAPTLPAKKNARGLRLVATDLDWSIGNGPEVIGAGEALLMAIAGRPDALADLSGEGIEQLKARVFPKQ